MDMFVYIHEYKSSIFKILADLLLMYMYIYIYICYIHDAMYIEPINAPMFVCVYIYIDTNESDIWYKTICESCVHV